MAKEAGTMLRGEAVEGDGQGSQEFIQGASGGLPEVGFEFSESQFNRIKVRTVGWQITKSRPLAGDEFLNALHFMGGEIVEDDGVPFSECGT